MSFTTNQTKEIFDKTKIGIGDIVEINDNNRGGFFGKIIEARVPAIVQKIEEDVLWLRFKEDPKNGLSSGHELGGYGIGVERKDEIKMIYRNPYNET